MKIKIALAIDQDGNYNAIGYNVENMEYQVGTLDEIMEMAVEPLGAGEDRYWLELNLPIPKVEVISGKKIKVEKVKVAKD